MPKDVEFIVKEMHKHYLEQLPVIAAMLIPDHVYDPREIAEEALELIEACMEVLENE